MLGMNYQQKCEYIAAHAKPVPTTPKEVDEGIKKALKGPFGIFLTEDELADAVIAKINQEIRRSS